MDLKIREDGELRLLRATNRGYFTLSRPRAWQEVDGRKVSVDVAFKKYEDRTVGFVLGSWDSNYPLMIDPTYQWHTFFGASRLDFGFGIAVSGDGVYVAGLSLRPWDMDGRAPIHPGGNDDIVIIKLDADGNYQWHTFYGSAYEDSGRGIAATSDGVYVTGYSKATWTVNGTEPKHAYSGFQDIVVLKLDADGNYQWHTFYGAGSSEWESNEGLGISATSDGIYVTGYSDATWTASGTEPKHAFGGERDIVVLKLDADGNYQWHTFYGSEGNFDEGNGITATGNGVYVTGNSYATWNADGTQPKHPYSGPSDIVVLKLDTNGNYQWHTFYGSGSTFDFGSGIATTIDEVYVTGQSYASWTVDGTEPIHAYGGYDDIVVLKLDTDGNYQWHTFYGSESYFDEGRGIAVRSDGAYITGYSGTSWNVGGTEPTHAHSGDFDLFVLKLDAGGNYRWHGFYGSADVDGSRGIVVSGDGVYVAGDSHSSWDFDGTEPSHAQSGDFDIFVLKLSDPAPPTVTTTEASSITSTSAASGGNVTDDGGAEVTARGVCWNTTGNPDTSDHKTTDGAGTGSFISSLIGLSTETQYYVRAYAINAAGTSYGSEVDFTTGDDGDGVDSREENGVPTPGGGTGDGNGDGIPDKDQPDVASLETYDHRDYATLDAGTNGGTSLKNVTAQSPAEAGVPDYIYMPFGVFHYEVHGVAAGEEVTMEVLVSYDPSITGYFKWNRSTQSWVNLAVEVDHTSVPGKTRIVFVLKEGGPYDTDGDPSTITDPGGPGRYAEPKPAVAQVSTLSPVGMFFLSILTAFFGMFLLRTTKSA